MNHGSLWSLFSASTSISAVCFSIFSRSYLRVLCNGGMLLSVTFAAWSWRRYMWWLIMKIYPDSSGDFTASFLSSLPKDFKQFSNNYFLQNQPRGSAIILFESISISLYSVLLPQLISDVSQPWITSVTTLRPRGFIPRHTQINIRNLWFRFFFIQIAINFSWKKLKYNW